MCFCHFPIWCPGSDVVLDCFDSDLCVPLYFVVESIEPRNEILNNVVCATSKDSDQPAHEV